MHFGWRAQETHETGRGGMSGAWTVKAVYGLSAADQTLLWQWHDFSVHYGSLQRLGGDTGRTSVRRCSRTKSPWQACLQDQNILHWTLIASAFTLLWSPAYCMILSLYVFLGSLNISLLPLAIKSFLYVQFWNPFFFLLSLCPSFEPSLLANTSSLPHSSSVHLFSLCCWHVGLR